MNGSEREEFNDNARGVADQFSFDMEDVKDAYQSKPESLSVIFNSMDESKSERDSYVGWSVFWAIFMPPIALYTGYKAYENHAKLDGVRSQVNTAIHKQLSDGRSVKRRLSGPAPSSGE